MSTSGRPSILRTSRRTPNPSRNRDFHMTKHKQRHHRTRPYVKFAAAGLVAAGLIVAIINGQRPWQDPAEPLTLSELQSVQRGFPFYLSEEEAKPFPQTLASRLFSGN